MHAHARTHEGCPDEPVLSPLLAIPGAICDCAARPTLINYGRLCGTLDPLHALVDSQEAHLRRDRPLHRVPSVPFARHKQDIFSCRPSTAPYHGGPRAFHRTRAEAVGGDRDETRQPTTARYASRPPASVASALQRSLGRGIVSVTGLNQSPVIRGKPSKGDPLGGCEVTLQSKPPRRLHRLHGPGPGTYLCMHTYCGTCRWVGCPPFVIPSQHYGGAAPRSMSRVAADILISFQP